MANTLAPRNNAVSNINTLVKGPAMQKRFAEVLGNKAPAFLAGVLGACNANPDLLQCNPTSVLSSAMVAATLNLSVVPSLGQAALVPYNGKVQFQIMTRGLIQLAQRSGQYRNINAGEVYSDEYDGEDLLTGEVTFHRVSGGFRDKGVESEIIGYFAYFETVTGFRKTEYWTVADVTNHMKKFSRSWKNGPWKDNFNAMARKTVLKSLLTHYGPMSVDSVLAEALAKDQQVFDDTGNGSYSDNPLQDTEETPQEVQEAKVVEEPAPAPVEQPQAPSDEPPVEAYEDI